MTSYQKCLEKFEYLLIPKNPTLSIWLWLWVEHRKENNTAFSFTISIWEIQLASESRTNSGQSHTCCSSEGRCQQILSLSTKKKSINLKINSENIQVSTVLSLKSRKNIPSQLNIGLN